MKKIAIHDYENARVLILDVPREAQDLAKKYSDDDTETEADAILSALGLSSGSCEWMDVSKAKVYQGNAADLVQDFMDGIKSFYADME